MKRITKTASRCKHLEFDILHIYHEVNLLEHIIVVTDRDEEIGPELMKYARIMKCKCAVCSVVFLAKVFKVNEICEKD